MHTTLGYSLLAQAAESGDAWDGFFGLAFISFVIWIIWRACRPDPPKGYDVHGRITPR